jgi:preprotein translocase subunit SecE
MSAELLTVWQTYKLNETMQKIKEFLDGVRTEMKKVSWPQQQELIDNTIIVVVFTIIVTTFIFGVDQIYSTVLEAIYSL